MKFPVADKNNTKHWQKLIQHLTYSNPTDTQIFLGHKLNTKWQIAINSSQIYTPGCILELLENVIFD